MHQRATAKVDLDPPQARPPISIKTEYGKVRSFAIPRQGQVVVRQIKRIRVVRTTDAGRIPSLRRLHAKEVGWLVFTVFYFVG